MGYQTIHKYQFIPETFPIIELLAIKISPIEISQLKNYPQSLKKKMKKDYVAQNYQKVCIYADDFKDNQELRKIPERAENFGKIENPSKTLNFYQRKVAMKQF